ncbi:LOG family protein [Nocardioides mangrovi]|uniref:Rossmann fold nucleotide-binding protein n=1 Tax=Nocardioides mangrovi TaxID=2874580 RepID=A0ABS7U843_9ACTN|nr:Rossmann fold nucleotide-binding protein [Nocardioides mangrovi]MBZ5737015.1 Rossmann fold nucleotide-binding protein [Nocardioides mangrovi]
MRRRKVVRGEPDELVLRLERRVAAAPEIPVDAARERLYSPGELYDTPAYADSLDARAHDWARAPRTPEDALCRALHDHAIDVALEQWVAGRHLVGVMGGHRVDRGEAAYADAARLGAGLGRDHVVATGGGPGAMEAANLGGHFADAPDTLADALERLAAVPSYHPSVDAWVGLAFGVLADHPGGRDSLGIPTWHYGHEPPNPFATAIAKYFRNSLREAILLEVCDAGIVFLPGVGGTVQEIFQDACENYYADEEHVAPMVLVGTSYWTEELPAWPLLRELARGRPMERHVHLVPDVDAATHLIVSGT